jgi:hypothetical protein
MTWDVEITDECRDWYLALEDADKDQVEAAVSLLEEQGPTLGRPTVAEIDLSKEKGSHPHNLKELRPGTMRVLFLFDPRRSAILLVGGNKAGDWERWYRKAIPLAERLYEEYLADLKREGVLKK